MWYRPDNVGLKQKLTNIRVHKCNKSPSSTPEVIQAGWNCKNKCGLLSMVLVGHKITTARLSKSQCVCVCACVCVRVCVCVCVCDLLYMCKILTRDKTTSVVKLGSRCCLLYWLIRYFITQQGCARCKLFLSTYPIYFCILVLQLGSPYWGTVFNFINACYTITYMLTVYLFCIVIFVGSGSLGLRCSISFRCTGEPSRLCHHGQFSIQ